MTSIVVSVGEDTIFHYDVCIFHKANPYFFWQFIVTSTLLFNNFHSGLYFALNLLALPVGSFYINACPVISKNGIY